MKKTISIIAALSSLSAVACGGGDTVSRVSSGVESGGAYNEDTSGGTTNEDGTTTPSTNDSAGSTNEGGSEPVVEEVILEDELKISKKEPLDELGYLLSYENNKACYIINITYHTTNLFLDNKTDKNYGPSINECEYVMDHVNSNVPIVFVMYCEGNQIGAPPDSSVSIEFSTDNNDFSGRCKWYEGAYCCTASRN